MNAIPDRTGLERGQAGSVRHRYLGRAGVCSRPNAVSADSAPLSFDVRLPLIIDLDTGLLATDSVHEALLVLVKRDCTEAWRLPFRLLTGLPVIKDRLTKLVTARDIGCFPINSKLENFAKREARLGREIVLTTAAGPAMAQKFKDRFSFVSKVIASNDRRTMRGRAKAEQLRRLYPSGFIYAGGGRRDLHTWKLSSGAIFTGKSPRLARKAQRVANMIASFPRHGSGSGEFRRTMRLHQWVKNALIFVPLILGGKAGDLGAWSHAFEAFFAFSLLASATYIVNDLWDLHEDRQHWSKRHRPLASGELSIASSVRLLAISALAAFGLAAFTGSGCVATLALYLVLSLAYSFRLKREPMVDVFVLAALFTLRLVAGVVVTGVAFSPWLLVFSMFIFLSLSLAKRQSELMRMSSNTQSTAPGRGYRPADAPFVLVTGVAAMTAAVLVMVIYLTQEAFPKGFYRHPYFLWGFAGIIFLWQAHLWLTCTRGELDDDPVAFALKDRLSLFYACLMGLILVAAIL